MNNNFYDLLNTYILKEALPIGNEQIEQMGLYADMLMEASKQMNLTSIKDEEEIAIKHFIDSLTCMSFEGITKAQKFIDIGTGAGFPGLVLKIAMPEKEIVLVDSVGKKIDFLKSVIGKLKLSGVEAIKGRSEELARTKQYRAMFDCALTRGVSSMPVILEYSVPFLKVGGSCFAMKGPKLAEEIDSTMAAAKILGGTFVGIKSFELPNSMGIRNVVEIQKVMATSPVYPRNTGIPEKKPLA